MRISLLAAIPAVLAGCAAQTPPLLPDNFEFWIPFTAPAAQVRVVQTDLAQCRLVARNGNAVSTANMTAALYGIAPATASGADPIFGFLGARQDARNAYYADISDCMVAKGYQQ